MRDLRRLRSTTTCIALLASLAGCAAGSGNVRSDAPATATAANSRPDRLRQLARSEKPDSRVMALPTPPGVSESAVALLPADSATRARQSVEEVLALLLGTEPEQPEASVGNNDPEAVKAYIAGRTALLEGRNEEAITLLERARTIDPGSGRVWFVLGQAQQAAGRRSSAFVSFERAAALGLRDPSLLFELGVELGRSRQFEKAATRLAGARAAVERAAQPDLATLIDAALAEALEATGAIRAARDLWTLSLETPVATIAQSARSAQAGEFLRRRGELWLRVGDLSSRLGESDTAAIAYEQALIAPGIDPSAGVGRLVHARLRQGRPAGAALAVVSDIERSAGLVEDRHMAVIAFLAQKTSVGPALAESLSNIAAITAADTTPTLKARLARASAAALAGEPARRVLREHLKSSGSDASIFTALLASHEAAEARLGEAVRLVQTDTASATTVAESLIQLGRGLDQSVTALARSGGVPQRLLHAALLDKLGLPREGLERLTPLLNNRASGATPDVLLLAGQVALNTGDWATARSAERALSEARPAQPRQHAQLLEAMQESRRALDAARPLLTASGPNTVVGDMLLVARLAMDSNEPATAEQALQRAINADRYDERAYEGLIALYAPGGPGKNEEKLTATARALRQAVPSSRVIRGINAQLLVERSLWSQAEPQLRSMLDDEGENPGALNLLVTTWERAAPSAPELAVGGERWLRERLAQRPESPYVAAGLARVLVALGRADEARQLIEPRLARWPIPSLGRLLEFVWSEGLGDAATAKSMALARLEAAPPSIENTTELAVMLADADRLAEAAERVRERVGPDARLTEVQRRRLLGIVSKMSESAATRTPREAENAIAMLDAAGGPQLAPQLALLRLRLVAIAFHDQVERLAKELDEAAERMPEQTDMAYARVLDALQARPDPASLFSLLETLALREGVMGQRLRLYWFVMLAQRGERADAERYIKMLSPTQMLELMSMLPESAGEESGDSVATEPSINGPDPDRLRAEVAYRLGNSMTSLARLAQAEAAYRLCLERNPKHAWASNNLGYQLLERYEAATFEESRRLIELAYENLAGESNVIDSMGWLRYMQGRFADEPRPDGTIDEGAVTLLQRAVEAGGSINPVILDHHADALWRAGRKLEASRAWQKAQDILQSLLDSVDREGSGVEVPGLAEYRTTLENVRRKRAALERNEPPPIAPTMDERAANP